MINFWSFKRSWNRVGKQQSLSLWTRYIPWPWVRCDCIVGHTFPKLHVHSGGYFVRTKLNTFPTTGILDSVKIEDNTWMKTCSKVMIDCGSLRSNSRVQTRLAQRQQALPSMTIIQYADCQQSLMGQFETALSSTDLFWKILGAGNMCIVTMPIGNKNRPPAIEEL
jgi:hypothetical protein